MKDRYERKNFLDELLIEYISYFNATSSHRDWVCYVLMGMLRDRYIL